MTIHNCTDHTHYFDLRTSRIKHTITVSIESRDSMTQNCHNEDQPCRICVRHGAPFDAGEASCMDTMASEVTFTGIGQHSAHHHEGPPAGSNCSR